MKNTLYYGDCLEVLGTLCREYPKGLIDLIYIDPPFNSNRNYNILFQDLIESEENGARNTALKQAFADTWSNVTLDDTQERIRHLSPQLFAFLQLGRTLFSQAQISYLTMMAIRIWYMRQLLKETGSFYLHCDPTMSHYLKLVCDLVFGPGNFRNEIIWCYRGAGYPKRDFGRRHDVLLRYSKSNAYRFNLAAVREAYAPATKARFAHRIGNVRGGRDYGPQALHPGGRHPDDWWQIQPIAPSAKERLGYPTQKPLALLERIIQASSGAGELVADFFCGCGTTVAAAQKLGRRWIGVDISHLAVSLIQARRLEGVQDYQVLGFPNDVASAKRLAERDEKGRFRFQDWVIEVCLGGHSNPKKTADGGSDGHLSVGLPELGGRKFCLIEVKSGAANRAQLERFAQVVQRHPAADLGLFVCFAEHITRGMEAYCDASGGFESGLFRYPRLSLLSVEDLLQKRYPEWLRPTIQATYQR